MVAFGEVRDHLPSGMIKGANNGRIAEGGAPHLRRNRGLIAKGFPRALCGAKGSGR